MGEETTGPSLLRSPPICTTVVATRTSPAVAEPQCPPVVPRDGNSLLVIGWNNCAIFVPHHNPSPVVAVHDFPRRHHSNRRIFPVIIRVVRSVVVEVRNWNYWASQVRNNQRNAVSVWNSDKPRIPSPGYHHGGEGSTATLHDRHGVTPESLLRRRLPPAAEPKLQG